MKAKLILKERALKTFHSYMDNKPCIAARATEISVNN